MANPPLGRYCGRDHEYVLFARGVLECALTRDLVVVTGLVGALVTSNYKWAFFAFGKYCARQPY